MGNAWTQTQNETHGGEMYQICPVDVAFQVDPRGVHVIQEWVDTGTLLEALLQLCFACRGDCMANDSNCSRPGQKVDEED